MLRITETQFELCPGCGKHHPMVFSLGEWMRGDVEDMERRMMRGMWCQKAFELPNWRELLCSES
jgi:hypothetical protein